MATLAIRETTEGCGEQVIADPEVVEGWSSSGL
jgi:hypothetical protein